MARTNYPKIEIFVDSEYRFTTTWSRTSREAIVAFKAAYPNVKGKITASFKGSN